MAIFLNHFEEKNIQEALKNPNSLVAIFFDALQKRVYERVAHGTLLGEAPTTVWWHSAAEYLSDAAMCYALQPTPDLAVWIKRETLNIVRKNEYEWVGPEFRDHSEPFTGHLETAHLCWGISTIYDLAKSVFSDEEKNEIALALRQKGIILCLRWISKNQHLGNWRSIMVSGAVVAAVVLDDYETVEALVPDLKLCEETLQNDGSFGESLQYANYMLLALTFAKEAIARKYPQHAYADFAHTIGQNSVEWFATSMFYSKPLSGWGEMPYARAANFNDSAAIFRPSGDLLLHIAARSHDPKAKGLAKWFFEKYYVPVATQGPHNLATLGMRNDWGFLTLPLLTYPSVAQSPQQLAMPLTRDFSNGNAFMRDDWAGKTIVAINGGSDPLHGLGHLHGDLNSFILVHNQERLLADPGHSCYRNLIHGLESSSQTHNTCTFLIAKEALGLQEDMAKAALLEQKSVFPRRLIIDKKAGEKVIRGDKRLICERKNDVSIVGAEVGKAYGEPIKSFSRFWIMAGSHALFVIDYIEATQPVTTLWNWLVNNKDRKTTWKIDKNTLHVEKNAAAMRIFHGGEGAWSYPAYGFLHDAYHPEPNQQGEGRSGDAFLFRFSEAKKSEARWAVHSIVLDAPNEINNWTFEQKNNTFCLKNANETWNLTLNIDQNTPFSITSVEGETWNLVKNGKVYNIF